MQRSSQLEIRIFSSYLEIMPGTPLEVGYLTVNSAGTSAGRVIWLFRLTGAHWSWKWDMSTLMFPLQTLSGTYPTWHVVKSYNFSMILMLFYSNIILICSMIDQYYRNDFSPPTFSSLWVRDERRSTKINPALYSIFRFSWKYITNDLPELPVHVDFNIWV